MADIDIDHLCRLARLELNTTERAEAERDLARIIAMVDQMQGIDTAGVEPLAHPLPAIQRLRADQISEIVDRRRFQALAPAVEDGLYLVPRVVE